MNNLRKLILLFMLPIITLPGETARTISFVPEFIAHYEHHNAAHHKIGFVGFILEHFKSKEEHDKHEHHKNDRENCPLSHSHGVVQLEYVLKRDALIVLHEPEISFSSEKIAFPFYRPYYSEYNGSIWQPPKIA